VTTGAPTAGLSFQIPVIEALGRVRRRIGDLFRESGGLIGEVAGHVLGSSGKGMRPTLLLLASRRPGGSVPETAILAGAVVELIHMATLIHDDSVDRSMLRRGLPTINSLYSDQVSVIMGDFVYSKAFAMMMEEELFKEMTLLSVTAHIMSRGEMHQLERKNRLDATEAEYFQVIDEKTASLFAAACRIGAGLRGSDADQLWHDFGREYGRAFQITDDLFDFIGDEKTMGKAAGSDLRGGRVTLPLIAALETATPTERVRIERIVHEGVRDQAWPELVDFIGERGGIDRCYDRAQHHADLAGAVIDRLDTDDAVRDALRDVVAQVVRRRR